MRRWIVASLMALVGCTAENVTEVELDLSACVNGTMYDCEPDWWAELTGMSRAENACLVVQGAENVAWRWEPGAALPGPIEVSNVQGDVEMSVFLFGGGVTPAFCEELRNGDACDAEGIESPSSGDAPPGERVPCLLKVPARAARAGSAKCGAVSGPRAPKSEMCNGIDDDCNGDIDETFALGAPCTNGVGVCETSGVNVCNAAGDDVRCDAVAGDVEDESCNTLDDDCDGTVDEDARGAGGACTRGEHGECIAHGTTVCTDAGELECDAERVDPEGEVCNDLDDDCDGKTDEGTMVGGRCMVGSGICEREGKWTCDRDRGPVCETTDGSPSALGEEANAVAETCNTLDDDCDGTIDEDTSGAACTLGTGACANDGMTRCVRGTSICVVEARQPGVPDDREKCADQVDDDCDGRVDEGCPEDCSNGRDDNGDMLVDCDDEGCGDVERCTSEDCAQALQKFERDGAYWIGDPGRAHRLYCQRDPEGGPDRGWTLVASSRGTLNDIGQGYYDDLATIAPMGDPPDDPRGIYDGLLSLMGDGVLTDMRFACRRVAIDAFAPFTVDMIFYRTDWYQSIVSPERPCFADVRGTHFTEPPPARRDRVRSVSVEANTAWAQGALVSEVNCDDDLFAIDFDDGGIDGSRDTSDWGNFPDAARCGLDDVQAGQGQWFIFVRKSTDDEICVVCDADRDGVGDCDAGEDDPPPDWCERICDPLVEPPDEDVCHASGDECIPDPCRSQGEVRLSDPGVPHRGRVELFYNQRWGTVSDDGFGMAEAEVVCRQLGFPGALEALDRQRGAEGTIWLDDVACEHGDTELLDCRTGVMGVTDSDHNEDAGVVCLRMDECLDDGHCAADREACVRVDGAPGRCVPVVEADCTDEIDNDEDGLLDCADAECEADPACLEPPPPAE